MSEERFDDDWIDDPEMVAIVAQLAPTVVRQEWAETQTIDPEYAERLRRRIAGRRRRRRSIPRAVRWVVELGAVAAVAVAGVLLYLHYRPRLGSPAHQTTTTAMSIPSPSAGQLTKSYPLAGGVGGGGIVSPYVSRIAAFQGAAYPGRLTLTGTHLPSLPRHSWAYELSSPPRPLASYAATLAHTLKIRGSVAHATVPVPLPGGARRELFDAVVQRSGTAPNAPLHSVAISSFDGRLIYHDTTPESAAQAKLAIAPAAATQVARAWLQSLGLPGPGMPLIAMAPIGGPAGSPRGNIRQVELNWPGVHHSDETAAILWVDAGRRVIEARLYPTIEKHGTVYLRSVSKSWKQVKAGTTPIGVQVITTHRNAPGSGTLQSVSLEYVLTTGTHGKSYLYPTYRFGGRVQLQGTKGPVPWFALVPAVK
jgi:hypothetical protein